ncbi:hypothetical protein G4V03_17455 [Escherichia coli]|nr:hypothetical protein [Escherichia coli]
MSIMKEEIYEHFDKYGLHSLDTMHTTDYRKALDEEALFWEDPHGFIIHTLSNERIVTNTEQLNVLIEYLEGYRRKLSAPPAWLSEN